MRGVFVGVGVARWRAVGVACAAAVLGLVTVVGCASDTDSGSSSATAASPSSSVVITGPEGTATMQNPAPYLSLWNPCSLPKSVPEAVGLEDDPRTVQLNPWQFCEYHTLPDHADDPSYGITVGVTTQAFDQVKKNSAYSNVRPTTVGQEHPAFIADRQGVGSGAGMGIGWGTSFGTVTVDTAPLGGSGPFDMEALLRKFVGLAYPYVPR
ncbi:DUF3558 domain-containing protein [Gordonia sp. SID5947]|nr:DUF3558 domain-containing protein [Gordonia sp. SID5947]